MAGDDPKPFGLENMTQEDAESRLTDFLRSVPQLSEIPIDTPENSLRVRHGGYDISGAKEDPNVNFPISRLREIQADGIIGELFPFTFSFVGACSQMQLLKRSGPEWVRKFKSQNIEGILLVPV
jgi:glycine/betaine/sarcosine/D-proline reductase family selenoprotein B